MYKKVIEILNTSLSERIPLTDKSLLEGLNFEEKAKIIRKNYKSFLFNIKKEERYKNYLLSTTWKNKKALVIKRASCKCEGCGESRPLEVHHKTYERIGMELLTDLSAYCERCHKLAHGRVNKEDSELKNFLYLMEATSEKPNSFDANLTEEEKMNIIIRDI